MNILEELTSSQCRCGSRKRRGETFCKKCYFTLTPNLRSPLYNSIGNGYEEAYNAAVEFLKLK